MFLYLSPDDFKIDFTSACAITGKVRAYSKNKTKKNPMVPIKIPISTNVGENIASSHRRPKSGVTVRDRRSCKPVSLRLPLPALNPLDTTPYRSPSTTVTTQGSTAGAICAIWRNGKTTTGISICSNCPRRVNLAIPRFRYCISTPEAPDQPL